MQIEKFRDRKFMLLLYPEDKSHSKAIEVIKKSYDYAMILHDKDMEDDGITLKKPHYHVIITTGSNQRWNTAISKELSIADNYIQKVKNLDRALEYLIHLNDADKYSYELNDVAGTLKNRLVALINSSDKTEGEKVIEIIELIENGHIMKMSQLAKYCAINGYWSEFRRAGGIFSQILKEHNEEIQKIIDKE